MRAHYTQRTNGVKAATAYSTIRRQSVSQVMAIHVGNHLYLDGTRATPI